MFFPMPKIYGVAQLDIEATLSDLCPDDEALVAAKRLRPLKCLVFLQNVRELPLPRRSAYKYTIYIVGAGLRPPSAERYTTADMCAPILPNKYHPDPDRVDVVASVPDFPFQNCCHWFGADSWLDVRVKKGVYEKPGDAGVYVLPSLRYVWLERLRQIDNDRMWEARREALGLPSSTEDEDDCEEDDDELEDEDVSDDGGSVESVQHDDGEDEDENEGEGEGEGEEAEEGLPGDLFGWDDDPMRDMVPIVDLWLDLPAHLDGDDIPDPLEFVQECEALSQIVKNLRERQARAAIQQATLVDEPEAAVGANESEERRRALGSPDLLGPLSRIGQIVKEYFAKLRK